MVYKNIENSASFESADGLYTGTADVVVAMEADEYTFEKTADPEVWSGTDPLTYTITLTNVSGTDLSGITVTDTIPDEVSFISTSVEINGISSTNFDDSASPIIEFGTEAPLSVTTATPLVITFQVETTP